MSNRAFPSKAVAGLLCSLVLFFPSFIRTVDAADASTVPSWIWAASGARDGQTVFFHKSFTLDGQAKTAILFGTCDNAMKVFVNGEPVAESNEWESPVKVDVAKHLKAGANVLAVRATNEGAAAGLVIKLEITKADGSKQAIVTDKSWTSSEKEAPAWQTAAADPEGWKTTAEIAKLGAGVWGDRVGASGAVAGQATAAESLTLLPGFKAQRLYSVPKGSEGSWVNMTTDPKGRLYVSAQEGPLFRVTVGATEEDTKVEKVDLPIGAAQGLLWAFDSLYVVVNGQIGSNGSGLYRLQDTNGDDKLDKLTLLKKIDGGGEHGPHAVKLGPDGKTLWVMAGNFTKSPPVTPDSPHHGFLEDQLLPRNPDGNGFATGLLAPGGWVCKTDENGTKWELYCAGFRNSFDFDFNTAGECFTYDADMEWDIGTPWYRPTRVCMVNSGGEYGWRFGTGKWPAYYPDSLGPVVNTGLGSPTGVVFGTGAKFPAKYQKAFFINDWAYGKILAVHMTPQGSGYTANFETFAEGKPFNVTDIVIAPDKMMYVTIGGRGTQSGLYRITYEGKDPTEPAKDEDAPDVKAARQLRHQLETFHGKTDPAAVETAWPYLDSTDRYLRYAARIAIEWQPISQWQDKALAEKRPTALINAMVALARTSPDKALEPKMIEALNNLPLESLSEEQLLEAMRAYGLIFIRMGKPDSGIAQTVLSRLDPLFPSQSRFANFEVMKVLVYLESQTVVKKGMDLLSSAVSQEDQIEYVFLLRNPTPNWTLDERKAYFAWTRHAEQNYNGGASFKRFIQKIKEDALATCTPEEKAAVMPILNAPNPTVTIKNAKPRQFVKNWQMADLLPVVHNATKGRNFEHGRESFEAVQCLACHRFGSEGGTTGPDLIGVGNRFSAQDVLESILEPSKVISDQYAATEVITKERHLVSGYVEKEDADSITIRTNPLSETSRVAVKKSDIEKRRLSKLSPMPTGLVDILSQDEILDLIAYVRSGGKKDDKAFSN